MSMDRYEEAMSRCKQCEREHTKGYVIQDMIEFIFPELANKDEKIKRAISYAIARVKNEDGILIDRITEDMALAWLEKQKEQNPAEWSEGDERILADIEWLIDNYNWTQEDKAVHKSLLKSLRPQPHWKPSEEQITALGCVRYVDRNCAVELESLYNDLKKLM